MRRDWVNYMIPNWRPHVKNVVVCELHLHLQRYRPSSARPHTRLELPGFSGKDRSDRQSAYGGYRLRATDQYVVARLLSRCEIRLQVCCIPRVRRLGR